MILTHSHCRGVPTLLGGFRTPWPWPLYCLALHVGRLSRETFWLSPLRRLYFHWGRAADLLLLKEPIRLWRLIRSLLINIPRVPNSRPKRTRFKPSDHRQGPPLPVLTHDPHHGGNCICF